MSLQLEKNNIIYVNNRRARILFLKMKDPSLSDIHEMLVQFTDSKDIIWVDYNIWYTQTWANRSWYVERHHSTDPSGMALGSYI